MKNGKIKVGDKIVEKGRVFRIFKIEKKKLNGEEKDIAHFRPYYRKGIKFPVISTVPVDNINTANIRRPVSKKEIDKVKKILSKKKSKKKYDLKELKEKFIKNEIVETAKVAKHLWDEKQTREKLPPTKKKLYNKTMRSLTEQFAFASNKKYDQAKKSIRKILSS